MKKRVIALCSGIGRINGRFSRRILKSAIPKIYKIGARTERDLIAFQEYGAKRIYKMPDVCFMIKGKEVKADKSRFLIILKDGKNIDLDFILKLSKKRRLLPILATLTGGEASEEARLLSDRLNIPLFRVNNPNEFQSLVSSCEFSVSERLHGAIFSILNYTPCFLVDAYEKNIALCEELALRSDEASVGKVLFLTDGKTADTIKEVGAKSSDFEKILYSLREDIKSSIFNLF